jgi:hypothetical protein
MRKTLLLISMTILSINFIYSQTNSFPTNGNVGIGTPAPNFKLDVRGTTAIGQYTNGTAVIDAFNSYAYFGCNTSTNGIAIGTTGNIGIGTLTPEGKVVIAENGSALTIGSGAIGFNRNYVDGKIYNNSKSAWQINGIDDGFSIQGFNNGTFNEPFKILKNGNIGIGTPTPEGKVVIAENGLAMSIGSNAIGFNRNYVDGKIYNNSILGWQINGGETFAIQGFNGALNEPFTIKRNGNIGIGTPTPEGKVVIAENGSAMSIGSNAIGFNRNYVDGKIYNISILGWQINAGETFAIQGFNGALNEPFTIRRNGNIGIGTNCPQTKLDVAGTIRADEVKVDLTRGQGCDYVFKSNYKLMDLGELEIFVKTNHHLPEIASENEMVENGLNMKEFQMKLLQKMEEMTLYVIEQNKKIELLQNEIKELKTK